MEETAAEKHLRLQRERRHYAAQEAAAAPLCGAPAIGGACTLPAKHNMGKADIPENHLHLHSPDGAALPAMAPQVEDWKDGIIQEGRVNGLSDGSEGEQDFILVLRVAVKGFGKKAHETQLMGTVQRELELRFHGNVDVALIETIYGK